MARISNVTGCECKVSIFCRDKILKRITHRPKFDFSSATHGGPRMPQVGLPAGRAKPQHGHMPASTRYSSDRARMASPGYNGVLLDMKWNESGFRPPLCTCRLNWAKITSWGWWDDWDDTLLQTQDSKFEPWRSEAEHATYRSRRLPTIGLLTFKRGWGRNIFVSFKPPRPGTEPRPLGYERLW